MITAVEAQTFQNGKKSKKKLKTPIMDKVCKKYNFRFQVSLYARFDRKK